MTSLSARASRMIRLALTGSIGMGKSTVAKMFERAGVPVFDADAVVRDLQANDRDADRGDRRSAFPGQSRGGALDREALALQGPRRSRTSSPRSRRSSIPAVQAARARVHRTTMPIAPALLFDIPLLFETGGEGRSTRSSSCPRRPKIQRERVLARPGMTAAQARRDPRPPDARRREARPRRFRRRYRRRPIHN